MSFGEHPYVVLAGVGVKGGYEARQSIIADLKPAASITACSSGAVYLCTWFLAATPEKTGVAGWSEALICAGEELRAIFSSHVLDHLEASDEVEVRDCSELLPPCGEAWVNSRSCVVSNWRGVPCTGC